RDLQYQGPRGHARRLHLQARRKLRRRRAQPRAGSPDRRPVEVRTVKDHAMNGEIAAILAMDGIASGAIYVLIGLGFVLIFAVTRVIFVPFGDIAAFTALSLAS